MTKHQIREQGHYWIERYLDVIPNPISRKKRKTELYKFLESRLGKRKAHFRYCYTVKEAATLLNTVKEIALDFEEKQRRTETNHRLMSMG